MLHVKNDLFEYRVVCDESNNSTDARAAPELHVDFWIKSAPVYRFSVPIPEGMDAAEVHRVLEELNDEHNQQHRHH